MAPTIQHITPGGDLRGVTISDLHLLAERRPLEYWESYKRAWREEFDLCVLNGDVFDFRWARHNDRIRALDAARAWLTSLVQPDARARFVVLMGNHDAIPDYQRLLDELETENERFTWNEHWFLLGPRIFCHGDMPDLSGKIDRLRAYRHHHGSRPPPRPFAHHAYATATRIGLTGSVPRVLPWRRQCARTDALLRAELGERYNDHITDVYLGHTHVHFRDLALHGKRFHNGGAPLPRGRFVPLAFDFYEHEFSDDWRAS